MHQENSCGCKNLLNFICYTMKFHKCHHTNPGIDTCDLPVEEKPTLVKDMQELYNDESLKDLDIKVRGGNFIKCHKYVLAATSSKWEQLLQSSSGEYLHI